MSLKSYLYTFLLGGILVPTAVVVSVVYYVFAYYSIPYTPQEAARKVSSFLADDGTNTSQDSTNAKADSRTPSAVDMDRTPEKPIYPAPKRHVRPLSGWMIVRRDFHGRQPTEKAGAGTTSTANDVDPTATPVSNAGASMSTAAARYSNLIKDSYLSFARGAKDSGSAASGNDSSTPSTSNNPPASAGMQEKVFAVLKGKVLFLYSDETKSDCLGALDVEAFSVGISRGDDDDEEGEVDDQGNPQSYVMREGELFSKRNAIVLRSVPRLQDADYEPSSHSRKRSRSDGLKRSTSAKSVRSTATAMPSLTPSMGTDAKKPVITRKSTQSCATDLKHMSDSEKTKLDSSDRLPPVMTALTKDMDDGTSGVPIPGQDEIADAAHARDKTQLEVEEDEKEKRRKEKEKREKRRTRIEGRPWYLFLRNNVKMEEWYLSLLSISTPSVPSPSALDDLDERTKKALQKLTARPGVDEIFARDNMKKLIEKLNTDPEQGNLRWLNGLVGRLFLGICNTVALEAFIIQRVMKKINKAKFPSWIEYIRIDEVDVGDVPPTFSKPMLKELTEDGAYAADVHLNYEGEFRLKVSAAGSFSIRGTNLGRATAQLNVRILSIKGNLRIKINKPPSNRIWWCFSEPPQIVMHVEPILASRRMQLNALTRVIEKQIRDGIAEACVMPYCDDIPFFDTSNLRPRGGIFDQFGKKRGEGGVPISTDIGAEGLEPKAMFKEDAKKPIDTPSRRRSTSLSAVPPSMAAEALDSPARSSQDSERDRGVPDWISKADRSSTDVASTSSLAKSLSGGTKKWFAGRASSGDTYASGADTPSTTTEAIAGGHIGQFQDSSTKPSFSELNPQRNVAHLHTASTGSAEPIRRIRSSEQRPMTEGVAKDEMSSTRRVDHLPTVATSLAKEGEISAYPTSEEMASGEAAPGSLMDTIRSRAKDKQALQTSVNQAKDAMRKWGTNWAAKRNLPIPVLPRPAEVPAGSGTSTPADIRQTTTAIASATHRAPDVRAMEIPRGGLSLQERLANATQLATSPDRKTRRSTELEMASTGGHLSQSLDDDDVPLSQQRGSKLDMHHLRTHAHNIGGTVPPKMPKRSQPASETAGSSSRLTPSEPAPPRLPPRASHLTMDARTATRVISDTSGRTTTDPETIIEVDPAPVTPPQLPSRPAAQDQARRPSEVETDVTTSAADSTVPAAALPTAEKVLREVIAGDNTVKDI